MEHNAEIGRNINVTDKYFRLFLRDALRPYGLNTVEGTVLLALYGNGSSTGKQICDSVRDYTTVGCTQDQLVGELQVDRGVMTRTMKSLEEKGYVVRAGNPDDCRSYIFSLTDMGTDFKPVLTAILYDWSDSLLYGLGADTLALVERALSIMAENAVRKYKGPKGKEQK